MARKRIAFVALGMVLVVLGAAPARASDPIGIYALIDRVVIEESSPQRVQVWGVFALSDGNHGDGYRAAQRGYLYYTVKPGKEDIPIARLAGRPPQGAKLLANPAKGPVRQARLEDLQGRPGPPRGDAEAVDVLDVAVGIVDREGQAKADDLQAHLQHAPRCLGRVRLWPQPLDPLAVGHEPLREWPRTNR